MALELRPFSAAPCGISRTATTTAARSNTACRRSRVSAIADKESDRKMKDRKIGEERKAIRENPTSCWKDEPLLFMALADDSADGFAGHHSHYIAVSVEIKDQNGQSVVAAHGNRCGIHHAERSCQDLCVTDMAVHDGVGVLHAGLCRRRHPPSSLSRSPRP